MEDTKITSGTRVAICSASGVIMSKTGRSWGAFSILALLASSAMIWSVQPRSIRVWVMEGAMEITVSTLSGRVMAAPLRSSVGLAAAAVSPEALAEAAEDAAAEEAGAEVLAAGAPQAAMPKARATATSAERMRFINVPPEYWNEGYISMRPDCRKEQKYAAPARRSGAAANRCDRKNPVRQNCPQAVLPPCRVFGPSTKRGSAPEKKPFPGECERQAGLPARER